MPANAALFQSRLAGKSVCFAGRFSRYTQEPFVKFLQEDGVKLVDDVSKSLDYLVLGPSGYATMQKKADKLNQSGAAIAIVDEGQFLDLLTPTADELVELLKAEQAGIERVNRLSLSFQFHARMPSLVGRSLQDCDLSGLHLRDVMDSVDLRGANLSNAWLTFNGCSLDGAKFDHANVQGMIGCSAQEVDFSTVFLLANRLRSNNLRASKFTSVNLRHADFTLSVLQDADLRQAIISHGVFATANLQNADLSNAVLTEANFTGGDLRGCKFINATLAAANLTDANVEGADFTGANLAGAILTNADMSKTIGFDPAATQSKAVIGPAAKEWCKLGKTAQKIATTIRLAHGGDEIVVNVTIYAGYCVASDDHNNYWSGGHGSGSLTGPELLLTAIANRWAGATPVPVTVTASGAKASLPSKELKALAIKMWCELFGVAAPSAEELKKQKQTAKQSQQEHVDRWVQVLRSGAAGVKKWNKEKRPAIRTFPNASLSAVDLSNAELAEWEGAYLDCPNANFQEADLHKAQLYWAKLTGAMLAKANCQEANLNYATLAGAQCQQADFTAAQMENANCCGADFTGAILKGASLAGAKFDEHTKFPKGFKPTLDMKWQGPGQSPALAQQVARLKAKKPLDIEAFMKRLEAGVEVAKLQKALSMLKADRFQLYAQVTDDHLAGIVKSQGDPNLVYSCKLAADGAYGCCTQNLNICGGLRGSLCKHLLVLIVGLTKAGELDPNVIDTWVLASRGQKPALDKDAASETFLKYKGAEAGEVDWRPTETIPEDYYAM